MISTVLGVAFHLFELAAKLIASALYILQAAARDIELIAHVTERSFKPFNLFRCAALQDVSFAIEAGAHACNLLLGIEACFARSALFRVRNGLPLLVGNRAKNVGGRGCQIRFELPAQRHADAVVEGRVLHGDLPQAEAPAGLGRRRARGGYLKTELSLASLTNRA